MANKIISNLTPKTSPAADDVLAIEDTEATKKIDYNALADAILNKLTSKTYSVAGSTQTLISAIDALNSNLTAGAVKYSNYKSGVTSVAIDTRKTTLVSGVTYVVFVRAYSSSTIVKNNVYIITLLDNDEWAMSPIAEEAQSSYRPTSVTHSGGTITFTFGTALYGGISLLPIMMILT